VGLGVARQALGQTEEALASFEAAAAVEPNSTVLFSEIARLQLKVSAAEQDRRYLDPPRIARHPHSPPADRFDRFLSTQVDALRQAVREHPGHADLHYRLGLLLRQENDLDGAIASFQRAVDINPHYFKALTKLGLALREAGQFERAVTILEKALAIDPETVDLHYQLGLIFADRNEFRLALERFQYAVAQEPDRLEYVANLALALQDIGLVERANASWQTFRDLASYASREALSPR
jgi:tetratricopeptide (TPR) repeat protein